VTSDPTAFKARQRASWDDTSEGWAAWHDEFERGAAVVTARLLELAGVRPRQRVLDVATGHGEPALTAAAAVGPEGRVVGIDISPGMLAKARDRAGDAGQVEFAEGDMEAADFPPGSFDVVLSRFGLMLALDHVGTFRALARVLAPGGVLAAAVWGPAETHLLSAGPVALTEHLGLPAPPPGVPSTFSMADAGKLAGELTEAGFEDVEVTEQVVPFRFASVDDYVRFNRDVLPKAVLRMIHDRFGSEDDPDTWGAMAQAVEKYTGPDGAVDLPSTALCFRAVKPLG
jgi:SAM-dependent methyltransferase